MAASAEAGMGRERPTSLEPGKSYTVAPWSPGARRAGPGSQRGLCIEMHASQESRFDGKDSAGHPPSPRGALCCGATIAFGGIPYIMRWRGDGGRRQIFTEQGRCSLGAPPREVWGAGVGKIKMMWRRRLSPIARHRRWSGALTSRIDGIVLNLVYRLGKPPPRARFSAGRPGPQAKAWCRGALWGALIKLYRRISRRPGRGYR